jgi:uncharacterized repeat protein (TIGR03803 family)
MRILALGLYSGAMAALLAGCLGSQPIGAPGAIPQSGRLAPAPKLGHPLTSPSYTVLYRFHKGDVNGAHPQAGLIDVNGTLYGTTVDGGSSGLGTVYSISPSGSEKVLYSFVGGSDGATPEAELVNVNGTLYGTTYYGGSGAGTVYSISTSGGEKVLYRFTAGTDGENPRAELIDANGTLYGTTQYGGVSNCACGTVFSISTAGKHKLLHDFGPNSSDGLEPQAGLIAVNGALYGTTVYGGGTGCGGAGCGTVFSISASGAEKVLYSFAAGSDGEHPNGTLVDVNGTLYGTTGAGGGSGCELGFGCGTVYTVTTTGTEKVLYSFAGGSDGEHPTTGLIDVNGTLYGTTINGGGSGCTYPNLYCGAVFGVSTSGAETVLHSFTYEPDGMKPWMRLLNVNGTLYGTTTSGGRGCIRRDHCGVVFALTP